MCNIYICIYNSCQLPIVQALLNLGLDGIVEKIKMSPLVFCQLSILRIAQVLCSTNWVYKLLVIFICILIYISRLSTHIRVFLYKILQQCHTCQFFYVLITHSLARAIILSLSDCFTESLYNSQFRLPRFPCKQKKYQLDPHNREAIGQCFSGRHTRLLRQCNFDFIKISEKLQFVLKSNLQHLDLSRFAIRVV